MQGSPQILTTFKCLIILQITVCVKGINYWQKNRFKFSSYFQQKQNITFLNEKMDKFHTTELQYNTSKSQKPIN